MGRKFAQEYLRTGVVVAIFGDLGAGKTQFSKGIAEACGIEERSITSPTFSLANEYECQLPGTSKETHSLLYHLDCYRFEKPEELLELGVEDYLYPEQAATVVEWAERIEQYLPTPRIEVRLQLCPEVNDRRITITQISSAE
jgi:tRNA threonylcarbamoyladenosine biosynthesis protein TsaE